MATPPEIKFSDIIKYSKALPHQIEFGEKLDEILDRKAYLTIEDLNALVPVWREPMVSPPIKAPESDVPVLQAGIGLIKEFEGCELEAYPDPGTGGVPWTIGYGSTYKKDGSAWQPGDRITQAEAEEMLDYMVKNDFLPSLKEIPTWGQMNSNQQGAILSFAWNVGANFYNANGFNTISRALSDRQYWGNVPDALMLYVNPGSNVEEGLRRRRIAEGDLWNKVWIA